MNQWLDLRPPAPPAPSGWSLRHYRRLAPAGAALAWRRLLLPPHQLVEVRADGITVLQVRPQGVGRSRITRIDLEFAAPAAPAPALRFLAGRIVPYTRRRSFAMMEQVERGIAEFGYAPRLTAERITTIMKGNEPIDP